MAGASPFDYGVYHFRRTVELAAAPSSFLIHVTADNRYKLYINGDMVSLGPARGDLYHWRYESVDIARHLKPGKNVIAAVVWNFGAHAPVAQITNQAGLLVQGDSAAERVVDTGKQWKAIRDEAFEAAPPDPEMSRFYYVAGPGDRVDANRYPWGWEQAEFDDSGWPAAAVGSAGAPRDSQDGPNRWMLVPSSIPPMELKPQPITEIRRVVTNPAPAGSNSALSFLPHTFLPHTRATVLFDQRFLTTAYPQLTVSGGKGAKIEIGYAEALWLPGFQDKGNRNEIAGKDFIGARDIFIADGGRERRFEPLWWRTWRYLRLSIETHDEGLVIDDLGGVYTGYPFRAQSPFRCRLARARKNSRSRLAHGQALRP